MRSQRAPIGGRTTHGTRGAQTTRLIYLLFSLGSYGAAIFLIHKIPIAINEPAVFVLLFTLRDLYLARVYLLPRNLINFPDSY